LVFVTKVVVVAVVVVEWQFTMTCTRVVIFMVLRIITLTAHSRWSVASPFHTQYAVYVFILLLVTKFYHPRSFLLLHHIKQVPFSLPLPAFI
jgi:hypothetical protein